MSPLPSFVQPAGWLDRAGGWFLHSGIQEAGGGVARFYRSDLGRNARVSTEITGYAASALTWLHRRTGNAGYLEAAVRAGRFLARTAWDPAAGALPFEHSQNGDAPSQTWFFDCGIVARGLLALWRATGEREYLETASGCACSMNRDFSGEGGFHPVLALPGKAPLPYEPKWSREPGCYQLKSALAWHDLARETGDAGWSRLFAAALGRALANERAFLPGSGNRERVVDRLHAYCYFLEALLAVPEQTAVLRAGIARAAAWARDIAPEFERSDVWAQLLRVRLFADALGIVPLDEGCAEEEAQRAASFQDAGGDPRTCGGFWFGRKRGETLPYSNPVSTAFCAQALDMWQHRGCGAVPPLTDLI